MLRNIKALILFFKEEHAKYICGITGNPARKNGKQTNKNCEPVCALSPLELHFTSCEHQLNIKTVFNFFSPQYSCFNLLAEGALEKQNMTKWT